MEAVDRDEGRLRELARRARRAGGRIRVWAADLERIALPRGRYDLVVNTRYLQRSLAPALEEALRPGGMLLFETFTEEQRRFGRPRHPAFLLRRGELAGMFPGLEILALRKGIRDGREAVASLVARRPGGRRPGGKRPGGRR